MGDCVGERVSSIRDLYTKTVSCELPTGESVTFARLTVRDWAEMGRKIRDERLAAELKAIGGLKDPIVQQTLRLRAQAFEPTYYDLIDSALTADGIARVLPFSAIKAGTPKELAEQVPDLLQPSQVQQVMSQITHAPVGARIGGDIGEGQPANPTSAESSPLATGTSEPSAGSESPLPLIGLTSDGESEVTTESTSTT